MLAQSLAIDKPSLKVKEREARASTFKNGKNGKVKHGIDSIGNVRVQRYTGLICAQPSLTVLETIFSNMRTCARHLDSWSRAR
jgi:hypothetical protein